MRGVRRMSEAACLSAATETSAQRIEGHPIALDLVRPEFDGCSESATCFLCPLPRCKFDVIAGAVDE